MPLRTLVPLLVLALALALALTACGDDKPAETPTPREEPGTEAGKVAADCDRTVSSRDVRAGAAARRALDLTIPG